jgi:hypothetical protein
VQENIDILSFGGKDPTGQFSVFSFVSRDILSSVAVLFSFFDRLVGLPTSNWNLVVSSSQLDCSFTRAEKRSPHGKMPSAILSKVL